MNKKGKKIPKENERNTEEVESVRFYYACEEIQKTGITPEDFENACDIVAFASLFAQKFDHGAGLSVNTSARPVNKFYVGDSEPDIIGMYTNERAVKIAISDLLVSLDGAGAIVNGRIDRAGGMIAMGAKNCGKAMKSMRGVKSNRRGKPIDHDVDGTHTRHGSMTAYSMVNPHSVDFVVSHRGRAVILVKGKALAQISRIEGPDGPTFIQPYYGSGYPAGDDQIFVRTGSPRVLDMVQKGFNTGDVYMEYLVKARAEERWKKRLALTQYMSQIAQEAQADENASAAEEKTIVHNMNGPLSLYPMLMRGTRYGHNQKQTFIEQFFGKMRKKLLK